MDPTEAMPCIKFDMSDFSYHVATDLAKIAEVYGLGAQGWGNGLSTSQLGEMERRQYEVDLAHKRLHYGFYCELSKGEIVALAFVRALDAYYKHGAITPITVLLIGHVFTSPEWRCHGLGSKLIDYAIAYTEEQLAKEENAAEKYVWYLNSGKGEWYGKFGFKGYPILAYEVPFSIGQHEQDLRMWGPQDHAEIEQVIKRKTARHLAQLESGPDNTIMYAPDFLTLKGMYQLEREQSSEIWSPESQKYHSELGAVTEDGYYILWATQKYYGFFILLMGHVTEDKQVPATEAARLVRAACFNGAHRELPDQESLLVHTDDLETDIAALLDILGSDKIKAYSPEEFTEISLPMLRKFGSNEPNIDVNWLYSTRLQRR